MRRLLNILMLISALSLTACGGGSVGGGGGGGGDTDENVGSVTMSSGRSSVPADGATAATITVVVRNESGDVMNDEAVTLTTSTGTLSVTSGNTNNNGRITTDLTIAPGTSATTVTVEATAGGVTGSITLDVITSFLSSLQLVTSNPQLQSDGSGPVTLTAFVRDQNNNLMADVTVGFAATSGGIQVTQGTSDASGTATATLNTAGDPTNRTITVTATATDPNGLGQLTDTVDVSVIGSALSINGPSAVVLNDSGTFTAVLIDAGGTGISGETVNFSSQNGNTLSASTLTTNASGQAQVTLTATGAGNDVLTATALGLTANKSISISDDDFRFTAPTAGQEVNLGANATVTLAWDDAGGAVVGENITFSTTRGTLAATSGTTNGSGQVSTTISSSNAGVATISATSDTGLTTSVQIEFVATTPDTLVMQADPLTIGPNDSSTITAIVRDASGNRVKNQQVRFTLVDTTGGSLSSGLETTDSLGRAQIVYTASDATSAEGGVQVSAELVSNNAINDSVALTVARRQVFVSIGTGNELEEPNSTQYTMPFVVQVSDASGNGVEGVDLQLSVLSDFYYKGFWTRGASVWEQTITAGGCPDEDINRNGILDAGEDLNGSGLIEAGNIASVGPVNVTTDEDGFAFIDVTYPQEFALWVEVTLTASTNVQGTEFAEPREFFLSISADDISLDTTPPGQLSPFGTSANCGDTD